MKSSFPPQPGSRVVDLVKDPKCEESLTRSTTIQRHVESRRNNTCLIGAAATTIFLYAAIAWLSWRFDYHSAGVDRPILAVLSLFMATFVVYLLATVWVYRSKTTTRSFQLIVGAAIVFRVVMLFSIPIQEVDIYRYLWDGAVTSEGISPFAHSPLSVQQAAMNRDGIGITSGDVERLVALLDREPGISEALGRVHFPELPTIYPATSQAVFTLVDITTPSHSSLLARVFIMKAWLIGFDVATLFTVIALLRRLGKPITWCIAYAWCPLLMKEVAGSGHLDAIAVFLTTMTIYLVVQLITHQTKTHRSEFATSGSLAVTGFVFALAVGAKLYPIVLAPLMIACVAKKFGWRHTVVPTITAGLLATGLLWPMLPKVQAGATDPSEGVTTFLKQWEMNDFLFLILIENIKPTETMAAEHVAWFSVIPESARDAITEQVVRIANVDIAQVPFFVSRAITLGLFAVIAIGLAWRVTRSSKTRCLHAELICESAFLTLAWFWLLAPTQNPWYWTWALPFLPFARGRAWMAVSGLVLLYYLRFWFDYHYAETPVFGTRYRGIVFYDLVITWIEFAPWMGFLAIDTLRRFLQYAMQSDYPET